MKNQQIQSIERRHQNQVLTAQFSPDSKFIASGSYDSTIRLWNIENKNFLKIGQHDDAVLTVAFSQNGKSLVSGSEDKTIRLWDLKQKTSYLLGQLQAGVSQVVFSLNQKYIYSGSYDKTVTRWTIFSKKFVILGKHKDAVNQIGLSQDGKFVASASKDQTIIFWRLNSTKTTQIGKQGDIDNQQQQDLDIQNHLKEYNIGPLQSKNDNFQEHNNNKNNQVSDGKQFKSDYLCINYSPDSTYIVSGSKLGFIRLHYTKDKDKTDKEIGKHEQEVNSVVFSSKYEMIASGSDDCQVILWSLKDEKLRLIGKHDDKVQSVDFSPDCERIVSGSKDSTIRIWRIGSDQLDQIQKIEPDQGDIYQIKFSPDGDYIAWGSEMCQICHLNLRQQKKDTNKTQIKDSKNVKKLKHKLIGFHEQPVRSIAFSPDGSKLVSGSEDNTVKLWNIFSQTKTPNIIQTFYSQIKTVVFSKSGLYVISGSNDCSIQQYSLITSKNQTIDKLMDPILQLVVSDDDKFVTSLTKDQQILQRDLEQNETETLEDKETQDKQQIRAVVQTHDGKYIFSGANDGRIIKWDLKEKKIIYSEKIEKAIRSIAISSQGTYLITGSDDKTVRLWKTDLSKNVELYKHNKGVLTVAISPNDQYVASGSIDYKIFVWQINSQKQENQITFQYHSKSVNSVAFSPDSNYLVSGSNDRRIILLDIKKKKIFKLGYHNEAVSSVVFSPDGKFIASGSSDDQIRLWDLLQDDFVVIGKHDNQVLAVQFSPDGSQIVSSSTDKTIRVWNILLKRQDKIFRLVESCSSITFSLSGQYLFFEEDCKVKYFDLWKSNSFHQFYDFIREVQKQAIKEIVYNQDLKMKIYQTSIQNLNILQFFIIMDKSLEVLLKFLLATSTKLHIHHNKYVYQKIIDKITNKDFDDRVLLFQYLINCNTFDSSPPCEYCFMSKELIECILSQKYHTRQFIDSMIVTNKFIGFIDGKKIRDQHQFFFGQEVKSIKDLCNNRIIPNLPFLDFYYQFNQYQLRDPNQQQQGQQNYQKQKTKENTESNKNNKQVQNQDQNPMGLSQKDQENRQHIFYEQRFLLLQNNFLICYIQDNFKKSNDDVYNSIYLRNILEAQYYGKFGQRKFLIESFSHLLNITLYFTYAVFSLSNRLQNQYTYVENEIYLKLNQLITLFLASHFLIEDIKEVFWCLDNEFDYSCNIFELFDLPCHALQLASIVIDLYLTYYGLDLLLLNVNHGITIFAIILLGLSFFQYFHISKNFSRYVSIIMHVLKELKYFFVFFIVFIVEFFCIYYIIQLNGQDNPYFSRFLMLKSVYGILIGDYPDKFKQKDPYNQMDNKLVDSSLFLLFILASVLLQIVLMNLLISIIAQAFDEFLDQAQRFRNYQLAIILSRQIKKEDKMNIEQIITLVTTKRSLNEIAQDDEVQLVKKAQIKIIQKFEDDFKSLNQESQSQFLALKDQFEEFKSDLEKIQLKLDKFFSADNKREISNILNTNISQNVFQCIQFPNQNENLYDQIVNNQNGLQRLVGRINVNQVNSQQKTLEDIISKVEKNLNNKMDDQFIKMIQMMENMELKIEKVMKAK